MAKKKRVKKKKKTKKMANDQKNVKKLMCNGKK